jgi:tetratricopeptide (TPR) repeat protein
VLGNLGVAYKSLGKPRKAIEFYERRLVIAREIGDRRGEGVTLGNLGTAYAALGEPLRALGFYERRLTIAQEIGDLLGEAAVLTNLGNVYAALGDRNRALTFLANAVKIFVTIESPSAATAEENIKTLKKQWGLS